MAFSNISRELIFANDGYEKISRGLIFANAKLPEIQPKITKKKINQNLLFVHTVNLMIWLISAEEISPIAKYHYTGWICTSNSWIWPEYAGVPNKKGGGGRNFFWSDLYRGGGQRWSKMNAWMSRVIQDPRVNATQAVYEIKKHHVSHGIFYKKKSKVEQTKR